jgi:HlyD family secretion protein
MDDGENQLFNKNRFKMKKILIIVFVIIGFGVTGCSNNNEKADAYGNFEAIKVTVSAQGTGQLLKFNVEDGDTLAKNEQVGLIDTTDLHLQKLQLEAHKKSLHAQIANIAAQTAVLKEQKLVAETDLSRIQQLIKDSAATPKQLDDATGKVNVMNKQIISSQTQKGVIESQIRSIDSQIAQINEKIQKSRVINPISGTVLVRYAEAGEVATYGRPLYDIANLKYINLRIYVSGAQLPKVKLGEKVKVIVDKNAKENRSLSGIITWVSSEAEFTPKNIQTKEERVSQVYAVKVRVRNDGTLKIGMPGEVEFK